MPTDSSSRFSALVRAALYGGAIGAAIDLCFAMSWAALHGKSAWKVPQFIASGLLGMPAFEGGAPVIALGIAAHFFIVIVAALLYAIAAQRARALRERPFVFGPLFGAAIFLTMRLLVVPLSNAPAMNSPPLALAIDLFVHMIGIGLPIAVCTRAVLQKK